MCWKLFIFTIVAVSARHIDRDVPVDRSDDQRQEYASSHQRDMRQMHKYGSELEGAGESRTFDHYRRSETSGQHHQSYIQSNGNINPQYEEDFNQARGQENGQGHVEPRHINTHAYHNHAQRENFDTIRFTDEFNSEKHREYEEDPKKLIDENSKLISAMNHRIHQQMYEKGGFEQKPEETYAQTELGTNNQGYISRDGVYTNNQNNRQPDTKQYNTHVDQQKINYNQNMRGNTKPVDDTQNVNKKPYGTSYNPEQQHNVNQGSVNPNPSGEHPHNHHTHTQTTNMNDPATKHGSGYDNGEKTDSGKTDRNPDRKYDKEQTSSESGHVNGTIGDQVPANHGTFDIMTETANSTVIPIVDVPNRAAFNGDKCPTGKIKVNDICVDKDD